MSASPKLLKARQMHSRWFAVATIPLLIFTSGSFSEPGVMHALLAFAGYVLVIACVLGRAYCSSYIGGVKNEAVMQHGPYSVVRNPLYVFSFLGVVGIGLQSGSFTVLGLLVFSFVTYYKQVVDREEAFLENKFGDAYRQFKASVPRWFPKLSQWSEPEEMLTRPFFIRKTLMDASLFFLALPFFELLAMLRNTGVLPTLFILP